MSIDQSLKIKLEDYDVVEIAPKVYKINEYNLTTMFVIVGEKSALALDTGTGVGDYKAVIERLTGGLPYEVALTHGHMDHAGGRGQFEKLYVSAEDKDIVKEATVFSRRFYIFTCRYLMFFKCLKRKDAKVKKPNPEPELEVIEEGKVFDLGGRTVEVFATPGHTYGSLSYLLREDRILFSGDILNTNMLMFLAHATTIEDYHATIEKIIAMKDKFDTLWASHLSEPLPEASWLELKACTEKIMKIKHNIPLPIAITGYGKSVIIHRKTHVWNKRKKSN